MLDKQLVSFDYAIPYLLKDQANYDIIEEFLSALVGVAGYSPVKINTLLEMQDADFAKFPGKSLADLIVQDAKGIKYIIAIDRVHSHFLHRSCFRASKLIAGHFKGRNGRDIAKVFHIGLLYSPPNELQDPVYYRKMVVRGVGQDKDDICEALDLKMPEYFLVAVPRFNGIIKTALDEWLYLLKNSDIKDDCKSLCVSKIKEHLSISRMSEGERQGYVDYLKHIAQEEKGEAIYD